MSSPTLIDIPRLPVLGWEAFRGDRAASLPSVLDLPHCRFTTSGRAAIGLALEVLGVGPGDRVLVPTYNCPTMIAPVLHAGAAPEFFPIDAQGAPQHEFLEALDVRGVRAIIAAHYFGLPQSFGWLREWCDRKGVLFIEDCAHAFFGRNGATGVGQSGDVAIASLTKFFPVVEGGCLVSARRPLRRVTLESRSTASGVKRLLDSVEMGARHSRFKGVNAPMRMLFRSKDFLRGRAGAASVHNDENGVPTLEEFADPMMRKSIAPSIPWLLDRVRHERIIALRRRNYLRLVELLNDVPGAQPLFSQLPEGAAPYVFPLRVENAEARYPALRATRLPLFRWDRLWPGMPTMPQDNGIDWAFSIFQLGCHQDLREEELQRMADTVRDIFRRHG